ncbi:hypothetical protein BC939DRAFT_502899 [Gamsiella multidivaricata]|uniref:uncharacterized protein n=1 Tax=Gamsiella multidivaricata TaxID=101098 RepID=UPI00221E6ED9|nr:uncharacterized protein BC939DRAFT_502899 [Gamsiella multidivaricata]KAG0359008.1 hypothetical protein BGZ54_010170 [Gamsiella multidivaricata]KAI7824092.1 hypothetical protein BC939DRAFT_502899 [Gamsiella multidivaricata]
MAHHRPIPLPRPKCFCGHVATAVYSYNDTATFATAPATAASGIATSFWDSAGGFPQGQQNIPLASSSQSRRNLAQTASSRALTINWVYECHFSPKQEGMVGPDYCHGCRHDRIEAEEQRLLGFIEELRIKSQEHSNQPNSDRSEPGLPGFDPLGHTGTLEDYYNPGVHMRPTQIDKRELYAWIMKHYRESEWNKGKTVDRDIRSSSRPISTWNTSAQPLWPKFTVSGPLQPSPMPDKSFFATAPRASTISATSNVTEPSVLGAEAVAGAVAVARTVVTPTLASATTTPITPATAASTSPNHTVRPSTPPLPPELIDPPIPDRKVCGFHMHALEYHKMQKMYRDDVIKIAQRAQCPIFNLSVTRWMKLGLNHLQKEPFNTVECLCGEPMVVSSEFSADVSKENCYKLVCPRTVFPIRREDANEAIETRKAGSTKAANSDFGRPRLHQDWGPCSHEILVNEVLYSPRLKPIHGRIVNDEWLDQWFQPQRPRESYFSSRYTVPDVKPIINKSQDRLPVDFSKSVKVNRYMFSKTVSFRRPVDEDAEDIPRPHLGLSGLQPSWVFTDSWEYKTTNKHKGDEWPVPEWCGRRLVDRILNDESYGLWSDEASNHFETFNVQEMSPNLIRTSVKKASVAAEMYHQRNGTLLTERVAEQQKRIQQAEIELEKEQAAHADLVHHIERMRLNAQDMPQTKCRICFEKTSTHAIVPCLHLVTCGDCASQVKECIVCRVRKSGVQRIRWG